jgi:hypothetical protein
MIKFIPKDSKELALYSEEEFKSLLGVKWLIQLEFLKPSFERKVYRKSQRALKRDFFALKQKWLGTYFAKEIQRGDHPDLLIAWCNERVGFGVFANEDIGKGAYIGQYAGVVRKRRPNDENGYCFQYNVGDDWESPFIIDAKEKGNYTRFINHSHKSNLEPVSVYLNGAMHIILITLQPIKKGEQLCYDYGPDYWVKRGQIPINLS